MQNKNQGCEIQDSSDESPQCASISLLKVNTPLWRLSCTFTWTLDGHDGHHVTIHHMLGCINWALLMISYSQLRMERLLAGRNRTPWNLLLPPITLSFTRSPQKLLSSCVSVAVFCQLKTIFFWDFTVMDSQDIIFVKCCRLGLLAVKSGCCSFLFDYILKKVFYLLLHPNITRLFQMDWTGHATLYIPTVDV